MCQHSPHNLNSNILKVVPGISHKTKTDNYNQTYDSIENKSFGDIHVIGRAITTSKNPVEELKKIKSNLIYSQIPKYHNYDFQ